jgi:hypothetical protein
MEQGDFIADVELPFGTTGTFLAPVTDASSVRVDGAVAESHLELGPGRHTIIVVAPLLASPSAGLLPPGSPMAAM